METLLRLELLRQRGCLTATGRALNCSRTTIVRCVDKFKLNEYVERLRGLKNHTEQGAKHERLHKQNV